MVRTQIIALSLGAAFAAVIGGVLIWEGLPGTVPQTATPPGGVTQPSASMPAEKEAMGGAVKVPQSKSAPPTAKASPATPSKSASSVSGSTAGGPATSNPAPAAAASNSVSKPAASASQGGASAPSQKEAAAKAASASTPETVPQFDTVRVEPSGDSVVAGHGPANRKVALLAGNKVIGDAETEDSGDFVIVPEPLAPGNYVLSLRSGKLRSRQSVTVSVPAKGKKGLLVALDEPGKPSVLLADPTAPSAPAAKSEANQTASAEAPAKPAPNAAPTVAFKTAEVDKGGFYASGIAPPGAHVRIYLNGSALADVTADSKGRWSLTIGKGMTAGHYIVRADALDAKGKVVARAQVPFDMPVAVAENDAPAAAAHKPATAPHQAAVASSSQPEAQEQSSQAETPPAAASAQGTAAKPQTASESSDASHAVVAKVETAKVVHGDSLWRISRETLGHGIRYTLIYKANASQIRNPNLIYPGQVFVVPHVN